MKNVSVKSVGNPANVGPMVMLCPWLEAVLVRQTVTVTEIWKNKHNVKQLFN